jgi:hypothetical protein
MTESLENIKKEQTRNDLLKLQLIQQQQSADEKYEKLEEEFFTEIMAHKNNRAWAKILMIIFLSTFAVLMYMCKQYSDLHALNEIQKETIYKLTTTKTQEHE